MAEIGFYHVVGQSTLSALAQLMVKAHSQGLKAVIRTATAAQVREIDEYLWLFDPSSFLPHGTDRNEYKELQPIFITNTEDVPNQASILAVIGSPLPPELASFERVLFIFDGSDPSAVEQAREHWRSLKGSTHKITYWRQSEEGRWIKG